MQKIADNQIVFAFWSEKHNIGMNTPKEVYYYDGSDIHKLKYFVNRGLLMYKYLDKTLSYNTIKSSISNVNKVVTLEPMPF
jgi:hypothetical protein